MKRQVRQSMVALLGAQVLLLAAGAACAQAAAPQLTLLTGFQSEWSTHEGGGVSTFSGSNLDGWWCHDPAWCSNQVSADGRDFTRTYVLQPNDPKHPGQDGSIVAYTGIQVGAPGITRLNPSGDTPGGLQLTSQTTLHYAIALNPEWFQSKATGSHNADVKLTLVLGHFHRKPSNKDAACNVALQAQFTPTAARRQLYEIPLSAFDHFSETCDLKDLSPQAELASHPIVMMKFEAAVANTSVAVPTPTRPSYPTAITVGGPITFQ